MVEAFNTTVSKLQYVLNRCREDATVKLTVDGLNFQITYGKFEDIIDTIDEIITIEQLHDVLDEFKGKTKLTVQVTPLPFRRMIGYNVPGYNYQKDNDYYEGSIDEYREITTGITFEKVPWSDDEFAAENADFLNAFQNNNVDEDEY